MKKFILTLAAVLVSASMAFAQDLAKATEVYNNGAAALSNGNTTEAIASFTEAIEIAEQLEASEEREQILTTCKTTIPKLYLHMAKEQSNESKFEEALGNVQAAIDIAKKYEIDEVEVEAAALVPQIYMQKGNELYKAKDMAAAAEAFKQVTSAEAASKNLKGNAALRLGQCLAANGDVDGSIEAYQLAAENGKEKDANKLISSAYLKQAQASLKAKKFKDAIAAAEKVNAVQENANAYMILGGAYSGLGNNAAAIANYEKYISLAEGKDVSAAQFALGALYQKSNNKAKAIEYYQKVVNTPKYGASAKQQLSVLSK